MTSHTLHDENGKAIGLVCTRGREPHPDLLKQRMVCRRWIHCTECQDHAACLASAARLDAKRKIRANPYRTDKRQTPNRELVERLKQVENAFTMILALPHPLQIQTRAKKGLPIYRQQNRKIYNA